MTAVCIDCFLKKTGLNKCSVCVQQLLKDMFRLWRRSSGEECMCCGYVRGAVVKGVLWLCRRGSGEGCVCSGYVGGAVVKGVCAVFM